MKNQEHHETEWLREQNALILGEVAHNFCPRQYCAVRRVIRDRRIRVYLIKGFEFVRLGDLLDYFEKVQTGRPRRSNPDELLLRR